MSLADHSGTLLLERFTYQHLHFRQPFLSRNLKKSLQFLTKTTPRKLPPKGLNDEAIPTKRRIINGVGALSFQSTDSRSSSPIPKEVSREEIPTVARRTLRKKTLKNYNLDDTLDYTVEGPVKIVALVYDWGPPSREKRLRLKISSSNWYCLFCGIDPPSLDYLRLHLQLSHSDFIFNLRESSSQQTLFIEPADTRDIDYERNFQLGPSKINNLDIKEHLSGNQKWLNSRKRPYSNKYYDYLPLGKKTASLARDPRDGSSSYSRNAQNHPSNRTLLVPKTPRPWYSTIAKQILVAGRGLPEDIEDKDEEWLLQRQRHEIAQLEVTPDEEDYVNRWNPYIMALHLSSNSGFAEIILGFVENNLEWLISRKSRKIELGLHISTFLSRGVINEQVFHQAIDMIRNAETATPVVPESPLNPSAHKKPLNRPMFSCECGKFTEISDRVACKNILHCISPYFHKTCAPQMIAGGLCEVCTQKSA